MKIVKKFLIERFYNNIGYLLGEEKLYRSYHIEIRQYNHILYKLRDFTYDYVYNSWVANYTFIDRSKVILKRSQWKEIK